MKYIEICLMVHYMITYVTVKENFRVVSIKYIHIKYIQYKVYTYELDEII